MKDNLKKISFLLLFIFLVFSNLDKLYSEDDFIIIENGIIPLYVKGKSVRYEKKTIIIDTKSKKIISVSEKFDISKLNSSFKKINAEGKYIIPGLIDGFGAINNQAYASAYLYMGVTSLIAVDGGRRGMFYGKGIPSPSIYRLGSVGEEKKTTEEHLSDLRELYKKGYRIVLLMYELTSEQIRECSIEAKKMGMGIIGELGRTKYSEGARAGIDTFVHSTRYSLDIAPDKMARAVAKNPFSDDLNSPKWKYYKYLSKISVNNQRLIKHAKILGKSGVFLMPTMSLLYLDMPKHKNPWLEPVSKILNPKDINNPADRITGNHSHKKNIQRAYSDLAENVLRIESVYRKNGAKYLTGSATDVWGTMPGISLHSELKLLEEIGLSKGEVIQAATVNFNKAFGWRRGKIQEGFFADILILNSNPYEDLENLKDINTIILNGKIINREKLLKSDVQRNGKISDSRIFNPLKFKSVKKIVLNKNGILKDEFSYLNKIIIKKIHYYSDGLRVTAYISYPKKKGNHPCIIYNRGGNKEFGRITPEKIAFVLARIASWGYVVAGSQYRGNEGGEGREEFGGKDVNDVLNLIPLFKELKFANTKKIGIFGWSRGGMMTYLSLMRTDKISAAVIGGGLADLTIMKKDRPIMESVYEELIPNYSKDKINALYNRSAIENVGKISKTTPILLLHGSADWRVSPKQSLLMAEKMIDEKIPFRLVIFEGGDHGLTEFNDEVNRMSKEWFDKFLKLKKSLPNLKPHGR